MRRTKGEGSLTQLPDGRWQARVTTHEDGITRRRAYYGSTADEARRKMTAAVAKLDANLNLPSESLTLAKHLTDWLEHKRGQLRPETWRRYADYVNKWIIPSIGKRRLARLAVEDVRAMHVTLTKQGLSDTSRQHAHGVLRTALQDALRWDRVGRNVAQLVQAPRRSTAEMHYLGADSARALLDAAKDDQHEALFTLLLTAGLRTGEAQALRWLHVDTERQRVRVVATLTTQKDGAPVFGEPKTQHSRRTVWLSALAADALERHREAQARLRTAAGDAWTEHGLVFTNARGLPLWRSQVRHELRRLLEKAQLPPMRVHDLRHSAATLLLEQGTPIKVVSELLGHSDVQTTLRIYAHVIEGAQEQAASAMDRLFHG